MRKGLSLLWALWLFCLLAGTALATPEQRQAYAENPEFVPVYVYEDGECFLELASVSAEEYAPPRYQISGDTHFISDSTSGIATRHMTFRYNYDEQVIYIKGTDGKWYWLNPDENSISLCQIVLADFMFQQCYNMPFVR